MAVFAFDLDYEQQPDLNLIEMLHTLRNNGHYVYIVSSGIRVHILHFLQSHNILWLFDGVLGACGENIEDISRGEDTEKWANVKKGMLLGLQAAHGKATVHFFDTILLHVTRAAEAIICAYHVFPHGSARTIELVHAALDRV